MLLPQATLGSNIVSVLQTADLDPIYQALKKSRARHAVVLNSNQEILGVLTAKTLDKAALIKDRTTKVQDLISSSIFVVTKESLLYPLTQRMIEERIDAYLVIDEGTITGVISSEDLLKVFYQLVLKIKNEPSYQEEIFFKSTIQQYLANIADFEG